MMVSNLTKRGNKPTGFRNARLIEGFLCANIFEIVLVLFNSCGHVPDIGMARVCQAARCRLLLRVAFSWF